MIKPRCTDENGNHSRNYLEEAYRAFTGKLLIKKKLFIGVESVADL